MQFLGHIRIVNKLGIVLFTNLVLLVAMGFVSYYSSNYLQGQLHSVFNVDFKGVSFLLEADRDLHQALIAERSMCFSTPGTKEFETQMKDYVDNLKQADTRVNKFYNTLSTADTKKFVDLYFSDRKKWEPVSRKVLELVSNGKSQEAESLSLGESKELFDAMRENLNSLTEIVDNGATNKEKESGETFKTLLVTLISITCGSLVFGSLITILISRNITGPLDKMVDFAKQIASGVLTAKLDVEQRDENGVLAHAFKDMLTQLNQTMTEVGQQTKIAEDKAHQASEAQQQAEAATAMAKRAKADGMYQAAERLEEIVSKVSVAAEEMSRQADEIRRGTDIQMERISGTATAMEEMNATVLEVARNSSEAAASGEQAKVKAQEGARVVEESIQAIRATQQQAEELKRNMDELGQQAESIGQIMGVITDIADQTNLLALNAAIEAARAGDAGRGFAVVADEVRKLAEKTMNATKEVGSAIKSIQAVAHTNVSSMDKAATDLNRAVILSNQSSAVLSEIVSGVEGSAARVSGIATAAEQQAATSEEINQSVEEVNMITQQTAQGISETTTALRDLAEQMGELSDLVDSLKAEGTV